MNASYFIDHLALQPHPEGGHYREVYRAAAILPVSALPAGFTGDRNISTSIYYLLQAGEHSAFHRIRSDEGWHYYAGGTLWVHVIDAEGNYHCHHLGRQLDQGETFQFVVPANAWFASEPAPGSPFVLGGCTVAPGFDFADFELADRDRMLQEYPRHAAVINRLCR